MFGFFKKKVAQPTGAQLIKGKREEWKETLCNYMAPVIQSEVIENKVLPDELIKAYLSSDDFYENYGEFLTAAAFVVVGQNWKEAMESQENVTATLEVVHDFIFDGLSMFVWFMIEGEEIPQQAINTSNEIAHESIVAYGEMVKARLTTDTIIAGRKFGRYFVDSEHRQAMSLFRDLVMKPIIEAYLNQK
ncbi:hypothetical protein LZS85_16840 [Aliivibrio fischeri]|uniref:hypothetical protein n=1 Tax=Aliivibrio fischeri TaxID=668 RepID=UPI001F19277E|nr:hypothetical protein [Aliivibrio fischeri]MCE7567794.1 hypothetical protein [Aliivibrio fischeri]